MVNESTEGKRNLIIHLVIFPSFLHVSYYEEFCF
jgi:hypothetical protein